MASSKKSKKSSTQKTAKKTTLKTPKKTTQKTAKKVAKKTTAGKKSPSSASSSRKKVTKAPQKASKPAPQAKKAAASAKKKPAAKKVSESKSSPKTTKTTKAATSMPKVGDLAPDFKLETDRGEVVSQKSLLGQRVVLYFYPKDDTPGCTREACEFQENLGQIAQLDAVVVGVSPDSSSSHQKFRNKYNLSFPLGIDTDLTVAKNYGVWVEKNMYGKKSMGIQRATFLIDRQGKLAAVWPKVKVEGHVSAVVKALESVP